VTCRFDQELLSAYIDGELNSAQTAEVESHLRDCAACRHELSSLEEVATLVGGLELAPLPHAFPADLRARLLGCPSNAKSRSLMSWFRSRPFEGLVAAALTLFFITWAGYFAAQAINPVAGHRSSVMDATAQALEEQAPPPAVGPPPAAGQGEAPRSAPPGMGAGPEAGVSSVPGTGSPQADEAAKYDAARPPRLPSPPLRDDMIVRSGSITLWSEDIQGTVLRVESTVEAVGGYVGRSEVDVQQEQKRAHLIARVPVDTFKTVMGSIAALGEARHEYQEALDVTAQVIDMDARLFTLRAQEARYLELVGEARDLGEMMVLEKELWSVRQEIESTEQSLTRVEERAAMSQITVSITQPPTGTIIEETTTFRDRLRRAFFSSWSQFFRFLQAVVVVLAASFPYILVGVLVAAVALVVIRRRRTEE